MFVVTISRTLCLYSCEVLEIETDNRVAGGLAPNQPHAKLSSPMLNPIPRPTLLAKRPAITSSKKGCDDMFKEVLNHRLGMALASLSL